MFWWVFKISLYETFTLENYANICGFTEYLIGFFATHILKIQPQSMLAYHEHEALIFLAYCERQSSHEILFFLISVFLGEKTKL